MDFEEIDRLLLPGAPVVFQLLTEYNENIDIHDLLNRLRNISSFEGVITNGNLG